MRTSAIRSGATSKTRRACLSVLIALGTAAVIMTPTPGVRAQGVSPVVPCPTPPDLTAPLQEIVSDGKGRTRGTIVLANARQAFPTATNCVQQFLRFYQKTEMPIPPPASVPQPRPGPTIRARLGDVVQLLFLNQINVLDFGDSIDVWENGKSDCDSTITTGYPQSVGDSWPNCFHGSTSGNIHFHGTHTNPNGTGDNVFLNTRPSPWSKGAPVITEAVARKQLGGFFDTCEKNLRANNLSPFPRLWSDLPATFTTWQQQLLIADGMGKQVPQQLWLPNQAAITAKTFPQYYIGAFPTCFVLPKYPGVVPTGGRRLRMGQSPGTHWYHAHKHGSTQLNVANGMAGAVIIEGDEYDGFFDKTYAAFRQNTNTTWTRQQPTLVVNQYNQTPTLERGGGSGAPPFAVNGSIQPTLTMYPGQVQLWRIVNASTVTGFYISQLPAGFTWRQTAQDGVQFDNANYVGRAQRPVFVGPANRVDLLVKAPAAPGKFPFNVTANTSVSVAQNGKPSAVLFNLNVAGPGQPMNLVAAMPARPAFLADISAKEVDPNNARTLTFNTTETGLQKAAQHTINGVKFDQAGATVDIPVLNTVGEWTIINKSTFALDHPFHIHVNPFQVTEFFDPAAPLLDANGVPVRDNNGQTVPVYMVARQQPTLRPGQCWVNPDDDSTWKPCAGSSPPPARTNIWWDVFPIPSAITFPVGAPAAQQITIPGYFKMRTRFVDYPGSFVLHCHILPHEDRGMMFQVNIGPTVVNAHQAHH